MDPSWVRMIDYNEDWLFSTIFRLDGSVALRSTLFAFPAAMLLGSGIWLFRVTGWDYGDDIYPYGSNRYNLVTNIVSSSQHGIFYGYNML
jgi:hypothetical protein